MRAGELRHRVAIEEPSAGRNTFGEEVITWVDVATVWAAVEPLTGQEQFSQATDQTIATASTRIRIRRRSGLNVKMRAVWGEHTYKIRSIIEPERRRREMWLLCEEINPDEG